MSIAGYAWWVGQHNACAFVGWSCQTVLCGGLRQALELKSCQTWTSAIQPYFASCFLFLHSSYLHNYATEHYYYSVVLNKMFIVSHSNLLVSLGKLPIHQLCRVDDICRYAWQNLSAVHLPAGHACLSGLALTLTWSEANLWQGSNTKCWRV